MFKALFLTFAFSGAALADAIPAGFNDEGIRWFELEEGLDIARDEGKNILLLVHTTWCPHCQKYRKLFFDARVEAASNDLVFVLIDQDQEREKSARYDPDGGYIPRTMVLDSSGNLIPEINSGHSDYRFFLDTKEIDQLLSVLDRARN